MAGAKILIVEDKTTSAGEAAKQLSGAGFEVVGIVNLGEHAAVEAQRIQPHPIPMDIDAEGANDGIDAARRIPSCVDLLGNSELRYRTIVETAMEGFWLVDTAGRILEVNDAYCAMSGYSRGELLAMAISDLEANETPGDVAAHFRKIIEKGADRFETAHRRKDGALLYCELSVRFLPIEGGRCVAFVHDITDRKTAEAAQNHMRNQLESLWDLARFTETGFSSLCDLALQKIQDMTSSSYSFLGFLNHDETLMNLYAWSSSAMEECKIRDTYRQFPIEDAGLWAECVHLRQPLIINDYGVEHPRKKGLPKGHVSLTRLLSVPVFRDGRITAIAASANKAADYTEEDAHQVESFVSHALTLIERRQAQDALKLQEERYKTVADFTYDWEYWIDSDCNLIYVSPSCERITGYTAEEFVADPDLMKQIVHPEDRAHFCNHFPTAKEKLPEGACEKEFRVVHKDGTTRWISHVCQPVRGVSGAHLGI